MLVSLQKGKYTVLGSLYDVNDHVRYSKGKHLVLQVRYGDREFSTAINMLNNCIADKRQYYDLSTQHFQSGAVFSSESENNTIPIHICDTWSYGYSLDLSAINSESMTYEEIYGKEKE